MCPALRRSPQSGDQEGEGHRAEVKFDTRARDTCLFPPRKARPDRQNAADTSPKPHPPTPHPCNAQQACLGGAARVAGERGQGHKANAPTTWSGRPAARRAWPDHSGPAHPEKESFAQHGHFAPKAAPKAKTARAERSSTVVQMPPPRNTPLDQGMQKTSPDRGMLWSWWNYQHRHLLQLALDTVNRLPEDGHEV